MPYPGPLLYPSGLLYPGTTAPEGQGSSPVALGDLVLNLVDGDGTVWALEDFQGWGGSPGSTLELTQRARDHGATGSEPFFESKVMTMAGRIRANDPLLLSQAIDRLNTAVSLQPFTLMVSESGRIRHCSVQRQDTVLITTAKGSARLAEFSLQIVAKDPRKYGDLVTHTTLLPSSAGGRTYPATYPLIYTGVSNTGIIRVRNEGNTQAPVWLRIDGPIPAGGWTVTHVGKARALTFATALALGSGEFVTVDMDRREVLAQGQSARSGYVTSRGWFSLDPGDNDIAFSAANYSATARLTLTTKPAWS